MCRTNWVGIRRVASAGSPGPDGPVWSVVFSPDGAWVATASGGRTARVFAVRIEELLAAVVAHLPRLLTDTYSAARTRS